MKIWKGKRDKNLKKEELVFSEHVHRNVIHNVFKKDGSQLQIWTIKKVILIIELKKEERLVIISLKPFDEQLKNGNASTFYIDVIAQKYGKMHLRRLSRCVRFRNVLHNITQK